MDRVVGGYYRLRKRVGSGSFGEIYSAESIRSQRLVAVKLENIRCRAPQLAYESRLYSIFAGGTSIPKLYWYGTDTSHNAMVIDLLGKSVEDLFVQCHHKLSLKTVLMLADQMLTAVEFIHNKNFIHRDIKPDNFVMGLGNTATQVFIVDFGLGKKYRDQHTHAHVPYCEGRPMSGTARYASIGALRGVEQSRRDDLESLGFVWMYLLRGSLPWMGVTGRDQHQKYSRILDIKVKTSLDDLCRGFPHEFVRYFHIVRALRFTERPNYAELRQMFRELFIRYEFVFDYKYDWCKDGPPGLGTSTCSPDVVPVQDPSLSMSPSPPPGATDGMHEDHAAAAGRGDDRRMRSIRTDDDVRRRPRESEAERRPFRMRSFGRAREDNALLQAQAQAAKRMPETPRRGLGSRLRQNADGGATRKRMPDFQRTSTILMPNWMRTIGNS